MSTLIKIIKRIFFKRRERNELKILHRSNTEMNIIKRKEDIDRRRKEEDNKNKKKAILDRQLQFRKINNNSTNQKENIKEVLEDMCVLGSIMKKEIMEEKKNNPEKFISIEDAIKEENKNEGVFCLGILRKFGRYGHYYCNRKKYFK
jgi:hypothetical protein